MNTTLIELRLYTASGTVTTYGAGVTRLAAVLLFVLIVGAVLWEARNLVRDTRDGEGRDHAA